MQYRVPFTYSVTGTAFVYANTAAEAENKVTQILDDEGIDGLLELKINSQISGAINAEEAD